MPHFRPPTAGAELTRGFDLLAVGQTIDAALQPGHFFTDPTLRLTWIAARSETIPWEIFRGRLLDGAQTRLQKTFLSWHVLEEHDGALAAESTISVKLDVEIQQIHVTRGLLAYVWEGYGTDGGVIEGREEVRWTRELVGTIALTQFVDLESLRDELICLIWQALVGTSRLPLFSVEAPLPAYVFGHLHYVFREDAPERALESWEDFLTESLRPTNAPSENVKLVEFVLRRIEPAELPCLGDMLADGWLRGSLLTVLRSMFNEVSLSPHTRFSDNALALVDYLAERGAIRATAKIDFLSHLLRQLGRHLTAYDLVTFHQRGANYPDALLLDAALKRYWHEIETQPDLFTLDDRPGRLRRRTLRQACLLRRHYEGHLVPDLPTSPGENARVMPASHPRVPQEQLLQPLRRRRQLYANDPLLGLLTEPARRVLAQSSADLEHLEERTELGLGIFIDRPLGYAKAPAEADLTPMLAHEAFSPSLARRRWQELVRLSSELGLTIDRTTLDPLFENGPWPAGLAHAQLAECPRPVAALTDVRKVADDFVILRTLPHGLAEFLYYCDWRPLLERYRLRFLSERQVRLCVQALDDKKEPVLAVYDALLRRRLELSVDAREGYASRAGIAWPRAGLRVLSVWEDTDEERALARRDGGDLVLRGA